MRSVLVVVYLTVPWIGAQRERGGRPFDNGHGWDIRLAVPGEPGNDYPTLSTIPRTSFTCSNKEPGYYADVETNCQVFRICTQGTTYGFQSFLCPNGTLFNQAVFVCDWWMNVNCKKSTEYFNTNEKHSNLKVGPQLMSAVKKMITHTMRYPYDKTIIRNNFLVTQEYKQPIKLYTPTDDGYDKNDRNIDEFYVYPKQAQNIISQELLNTHDIYTASTINPYTSKQYNIQKPTQNQYENYQTYNSFVAHPKIIQEYVEPNGNSKQISQNIQRQRLYEHDKERPQHQYLNRLESNIVANKQDLNQFNKQYIERQFAEKQNKVKKENSQQNYVYEKNQSNETFYNPNLIQSNKNLKQNVVSNSIPSTLITKTLTYRKVIENPKKGQPKSRIVFKTWIVKPTRSARLITDPTPYTYIRPSTASENFVTDSSYSYNIPDNPLTISRVISNDDITGTIPTVQTSSILTPSDDFRNPIIISKPTIPSSLYLEPLTSLPTKASVIYLPPTTYKPLSLLYIPPSISSQLKLEKSNLNNINPSYTVTKQAHINTNNKNLSFSDILTKEKLDITVNDIVDDTNKIINKESLKSKNIYDQNTQINNEYIDSNYRQAEDSNESDEKLTSQLQPVLPKSSRLIAIPSNELEPPNEFPENLIQMSKDLPKMPILKESNLLKNTIERTVSLKITIPEKIATLLFNSDATSNDLEILNTGSSNYLILNNKKNDNYIPLGKLKWNKKSNFSDSQDLVYSVLADSINAAKQYNDFAKQQSIQEINKKETQTHDSNKEEHHVDIVSQQDVIINNKDSKQTQPEQLTHSKLITKNQEQSLQPNSENVDFINKNIYSGQLYKLPVPVVTQQIYNAPLQTLPAKLRSSNNLDIKSGKNSSGTRSTEFSSKYFNKQNEKLTSALKKSENIREHLTSTEVDEKNSFNNENNFDSEFIKNIKGGDDRISAHIRDKTVGTINHPLENNKLISYKKDKSYYVYTQLNNNLPSNILPIPDEVLNEGEINFDNIVPIKNKLSRLVALQYIPTGNNDKEQTHLNNIQTQQGNQEPINYNQNSNRRIDISTNVDFTVDHPLSYIKTEKINNLNKLYEGPSSYSAPQLSIGNLETTQKKQSDYDYNSRLEDFENNDNDFKGYIKERPSKRFTF